MRNEFSSRLDAEVLGVYPRAEVAKGGRAQRVLASSRCQSALIVVSAN